MNPDSAPGSSVTIHLRSGLLRHCWLSLLAAVVVLGLPPVAGAEPAALPQEHPYQVVLRDYLATLTTGDFVIDVEPVIFDPDWVDGDEDLHRLWTVIGFHHLNHRIAAPEGLLISAEQFLLDRIEGGEHIRMRAGHRGSMGDRSFYIWPSDTIWWSTWDYPGNPYFDLQAVRNRAFVIAAVDMIMLDHYGHEHSPSGYLRRADFLGGNLVWLAYTYFHARDHLPPEVREAYETGLLKFLDLLEELGPRGAVDNMDMKALVSVAYLSRIFDDPEIQERLRGIVDRTLDLIHSAGICRDAGGIDASYNGIALVFLIWAAQVSQWPGLIEAVDRMHLLKGHLTLPEPDGETYFSPSHFNTRTGFGSANDQWSQPYRDIAAAMLSDHAIYLMAGGRGGRGERDGFPEPDGMIDSIGRGLERLNRSLEPSDGEFERWNAAWWSGRINYAHDYYREGFFRHLVQLHENSDPLLKSPYRREADFVEVFPNPDWPLRRSEDTTTFLTAKFGDFGAIVYTGPLGGTGYMNFGGGGLSAFWTPDAGSVILGRVGHPVQPDRTQQTWAHWRLWPSHALSGETADGQPFSSARLRRRVSEVTYEVDSDSARISVSGPIGSRHDDSRTAPGEAILGELSYRRDIGVDAGGVTVRTRLYADGGDEVRELYEVLPLFLEDTFRQRNIEVPHAVEFFDGDSWQPLDTDPRSGVEAVRVRRFSGGIVIEFEGPQRVSLSPEVWKDTYQSRVNTRNLLVHLLDHGPDEVSPLTGAELRYRIRPLEAAGEGARWEFPGPDSDGSSLEGRRQSILAALHEGPEGEARLRAGLQDPELEIRRTTTRALRALGERGVDLLLEALDGPGDFETRHLIRNALADVGALPRGTFVLPPVALLEGSRMTLETPDGEPIHLVLSHFNRFGAAVRGEIDGAGSLTIDLDPEGDGWTVFGEQSYSGGTEIWSGTVSALDPGSIGTGPVVIRPGGTLMVRGWAPGNPVTLKGGALEMRRNARQSLGLERMGAIQLRAPGFAPMALRVPFSSDNGEDGATSTRLTYNAEPLQPAKNDELRRSGVLRLEEPGRERSVHLHWEVADPDPRWRVAMLDADSGTWIPMTAVVDQPYGEEEASDSLDAAEPNPLRIALPPGTGGELALILPDGEE